MLIIDYFALPLPPCARIKAACREELPGGRWEQGISSKHIHRLHPLPGVALPTPHPQLHFTAGRSLAAGSPGVVRGHPVESQELLSSFLAAKRFSQSSFEPLISKTPSRKMGGPRALFSRAELWVRAGRAMLRGRAAGMLEDKTCCLRVRATSTGCDGCKAFKAEHSSRRIASQPSTLQSTLLIYSLHSRP